MKVCKKLLKIFKKRANKLFSVTISELLGKRQDTLFKVATVDFLTVDSKAPRSFIIKTFKIILPKVGNRMIIRRASKHGTIIRTGITCKKISL